MAGGVDPLFSTLFFGSLPARIPGQVDKLPSARYLLHQLIKVGGKYTGRLQ